MLPSVFGSLLPRLGWQRFARRVTAGAALFALLPARGALAQDATDSGWFDAPSTAPSPEYYDEPVQGPAPTPPARETPQPAPPPRQVSEQVPVDDTDPSALTTFRPALDPYGAWVADPTYGTVWVPNRAVVGEDFAPYVSRGHWALTADDDWIWVSDYPFGWAVFHYGRWVWISGQGWAWVPGRTYANAWVVWRVPTADYAYVGWAPMPPTWGWYGGVAVGLWFAPPLPYVFCPSAYVFDYRVHYHIIHDHRMVHEIAARTRVYPTPYRVPARPTVGGAGVRTTALPTAAPRGPQLAAARVPAQAVPASRALPPPNAARLAGPSRAIRQNDFVRSSTRFAPSSEMRVRSSSPVRVPSSPRAYAPSRDSFSRPSGGWSGLPRSSAPVPSRVETRSAAPAPRVHVAPSTSRSFAPSSHSFGPVHMGGGGRRR